MKHLLVFFILVSSITTADVVVIAHKDLAISSLSQKDVTGIYLGNRQVINELRIIPLDQAHDSQVRGLFYASVIEMPYNQVISHWSRLIFTGKGQPPMALMGNNSIVEFVRNNPNVIGYVEQEYVTPDVKVLFQAK
jgi:ABC-type phosphate transport system substrate-binding protein